MCDRTAFDEQWKLAVDIENINIPTVFYCTCYNICTVCSVHHVRAHVLTLVCIVSALLLTSLLYECWLWQRDFFSSKFVWRVDHATRWPREDVTVWRVDFMDVRSRLLGILISTTSWPASWPCDVMTMWLGWL